MEAWRQRRLGGEKPCTAKTKTNPLDSDRPSHGRPFHSSTDDECNQDFSPIGQLNYRVDGSHDPRVESENQLSDHSNPLLLHAEETSRFGRRAFVFTEKSGFRPNRFVAPISASGVDNRRPWFELSGPESATNRSRSGRSNNERSKAANHRGWR